jgi:hypothetical protein
MLPETAENVLRRTKTTVATKKTLTTIFFTGTKLLVFKVVSHRKKFNQYDSLAIITGKLSRKNANTKRMAHNDPLPRHPDNSMSQNGTNSRIFRPKANNESFSSRLFSGSLTV